MLWCITTLAVLALSLALIVLTLPIRSLRLFRIRPGHLLRGCTASLLILLAAVLLLIAWSTSLL